MALARVREAKDAEDVVRLEPRLREVCVSILLQHGCWPVHSSCCATSLSSSPGWQRRCIACVCCASVAIDLHMYNQPSRLKPKVAIDQHFLCAGAEAHAAGQDGAGGGTAGGGHAPARPPHRCGLRGQLAVFESLANPTVSCSMCQRMRMPHVHRGWAGALLCSYGFPWAALSVVFAMPVKDARTAGWQLAADAGAVRAAGRAAALGGHEVQAADAPVHLQHPAVRQVPWFTSLPPSSNLHSSRALKWSEQVCLSVPARSTLQS